MLNHAAGLENYLAAPQVIKHRVTILSNNPSPIYKITKGIENICSHRRITENIHRCNAHNNKKDESHLRVHQLRKIGIYLTYKEECCIYFKY